MYTGGVKRLNTSGAANVPKSRLIYGRPDRDGKYEMPLPFKDDEVYPPDLG